jgi:thiamine biosynthesis lipoprotein
MKTARGTRYVMGTFLTVQTQAASEEKAQQARDNFFDEVQSLEALLSRYRPQSEISQINQAAGIMPVQVSQKTYQAVDQALYYARLTAGAFDPTVQGSENYTGVRLDCSDRTVFLAKPGMCLDLGGIGKGFALDCALERVREFPALHKITIDFGGQLLFWTPQSTFDPISVAIENPEDRNTILATLQMTSNGSLSTSSNAEHAGHLLDPRTRRPAAEMASVTVLAPTGTQAEALSTALFVLQPDAAALVLEKCPGARAYLFPQKIKN